MKPMYGRDRALNAFCLFLLVALLSLLSSSCRTSRPNGAEATGVGESRPVAPDLGSRELEGQSKSDVLQSGVFVDPLNASYSGKTVTVTGTIIIFGNEPHTYAGIRASDGSATYAVVSGDKDAQLRRLQGRLLEFSAILLDRPAGEGSLYLKDGTLDPLTWKTAD